MKRLIIKTALAGMGLSLLFSLASCSGKDADTAAVESTKKERNAMHEGNELYGQKRYAEAEVNYKKALGENPDNKKAKFNLASAYIKQRGEDSDVKGDSLIAQAMQMLNELSVDADPEISHPAFYDRGNMSYKSEDYASAVELYKNALRRDPTDNNARENLRLAQLKLKEQQDQDQNQNQNQNQQNQDHQNQDQQNQDNKDQQNNQDNKENQDDQNQEQGNKDKKDPPQQPQQNNAGLSDANAQQILKAMEDKENATRQKLEKMKQGQAGQASKRQPEKPW